MRAIYRTIEREIEIGGLKKEQRSVADCSPLGDQRTIFTDSMGTIRKYVWQGGGEDSALTIGHYYDLAGRLRFVFITGGAVNDTRMEHRIYFHEDGTRIRETRAITAGPGYPFPTFSDEEGMLQRDPRRAYEQMCSPENPK